jgi:hypothetical protein
VNTAQNGTGVIHPMERSVSYSVTASQSAAAARVTIARAVSVMEIKIGR